MRILFTTDGSSQARAAGTLLAGLKLCPEDKIIVLTVVGSAETATEAIFRAAREDLAGTCAMIETQVREGYADEEILKACRESAADLLVVGAKGASGARRFLLGSVTARELRHAPCSVLVARPNQMSIRNILLAFDGTNSSRAAAASLLNFPLAPDTGVHLMAVLPPLGSDHPQREPVYLNAGLDERKVVEELSRIRDDFLAAGHPAKLHTPRGEPASCLLDFAEGEDVDLIVVGSHGNSLSERLHRFLLGSVAERVARYGPCSVMLVRQPGE